MMAMEKYSLLPLSDDSVTTELKKDLQCYNVKLSKNLPKLTPFNKFVVNTSRYMVTLITLIIMITLIILLTLITLIMSGIVVCDRLYSDSL